MILPATAQSDGVPVKHALVVIGGRDSEELQRLLGAGGTPSSVDKMLDLVQGLLSITAYSATTSADGSFDFSVPLEPGTYNASVFAPGYVMGGEASRVTVDGAGASRNVTIFMQPSAVLSGKVTDKEGNPLSGIVVAAESRHSTNYDVTMDDGVFVLDTGLKTGVHQIYAFKPAIANATRLQDLYKEVNLPVESRVAPFIRSQPEGYVGISSSVKLEQGKLTILNLELADSGIISGKVTDKNGEPIAGIAVLAFGRDGDDVRSIAITDADGNYALQNNLAPGQYNVIVPSIFARGYSSYTENVTATAHNQLDIVLQNSTTIGGKVVDASGNPVDGARISAVDKQATRANTIREFLSGSMAETTSGADGSFAINQGLANGTYIATASFGDVPVFSSIETSSDAASAEIKLEFSGVIAIRGTVRDPTGIPIENATVAPGFASVFANAEALSVSTDPEGKFVLTAPTNGSDEESLFDEVVVTGPSYETTIAQVTQDMNVTLNKLENVSISGTIIAQKSAQPPVEIALSRQGTLILAHNGTNHEVGIRTNSRVVDASFDQQAKRVDIRLEGVQGSAGSSELVVPKDFLGGPFALSLDGAMSDDFSISENGTHTIIGLTHDHGLQELAVQGTTVMPEFPVAIAIASIGMAAALAYWRLRSS